MQITFNENKFHAWIDLIPETVEETAQLLRISKNAKAVKPEISTYFSPNDEVRTYISLKKVDEKNQVNSISPNDRTK